MRKLWVFPLLALLLVSTPASAAYFVIENTWPVGDFWTGQNWSTNDVTVTGLGLTLTIYEADGSTFLLQICNAKDPTSCVKQKTHAVSAMIPLDVGSLTTGQSYTSPKLLGLPDTGSPSNFGDV